jgi:ElaB/YqjD/DUF883 family membrane-anchored ribosome-binding protein
MGLLGDLVDAAEDVGEGIADAVGDAVDAGVDAVEDAADAVGDAFEDALDAIGEAAEDVIDALGDLAGDALDAAEDVYDAFAQLAEEAWDGATQIVEDGIDKLVDAAETAFEEIVSAAEDAYHALEEAAEAAWEAIEDAAEELWDGIQSAAESVVEGVAAAIEHVYDAAASTYEHALDAIERTLEWLGDLIKDVVQAIAMLGACLAGIIVHNLAEADNIVTNFWKAPKKLSQAMKDEAKPFVPNVPLDSVYYVDEANLSANHFGKNADAMTFMNLEIAGVNLGYMVYIDDKFDDTIKKDRGLMVHELTHVDQYRKFKFEDAFACAYGVGFANAGFSYEKNPLEAEAFKVQAAYMAAP